jgi:hypothetical protein
MVTPFCFLKYIIADVDAPFVQQVFDLAQRQREPDVKQDRSADHGWRAVEIAERITHSPSLPEDGWIGSEFALTMPAVQLCLTDS